MNYIGCKFIAQMLGEVGIKTKVWGINTLTSIDDIIGENGYKLDVFCVLNSAPDGLPGGFLSPTRFFVTVANIGDYYIYQYIYDRNGDIYSRYRYNNVWSLLKKW